MSTEPIATRHCACGWPRPLIAVTLADGQRPPQDYQVRYDCPSCGAAYVTGELAEQETSRSPRAQNLARAQPERVLVADPARTHLATTGFYVRAHRSPEDPGFGPIDIAHLSRESLRRWLRSNPEAAEIMLLGVIFEHDVEDLR